MSTLQKILDNPVVKFTLKKQLKKSFEETGMTMVTVQLDEKGELSFVSYEEPVKVITEKLYNQLTTPEI